MIINREKYTLIIGTNRAIKQYRQLRWTANGALVKNTKTHNRLSNIEHTKMDQIFEIGTFESQHSPNFIKIGQTFNFDYFGGGNKDSL